MSENSIATRKMKYSGVEWIGEIPEDWEIICVRHLFRIGRGRVIAQTELKEDGEFPVYSSQTMSDGCLGYLDTYDFDADQLTWTTDGANAGTVFLRRGKYNCTNVCGTLLPCSPKIEIRYQKYSLEYISFYHKRADTNGYKIMNNEMAAIKTIVPPIDTQHRIADFLDDKCGKIDQYIEKQQRIIDKLKEYKQAVITEAVTKGLNPDVPMKDSGIEWIGMIPEHWDVHKFCWDYNSSLGKMLDTKRVKGTFLFKYIKNTNVHWGSIDLNDLDEMDFDFSELDRYSLKPGDLMICEGGEIGKCAIIPNDFPKNIFYQKALHRVRPVSDDSNNEFLFYVMFCMAKNNYFFSSSEKATIAHLPGDTLNSLRIPFPPKKEQEILVQHLNDESSKIDCAIAKQTSIIEKLTEYKKSLIYEAVTGKMEV